MQDIRGARWIGLAAMALSLTGCGDDNSNPNQLSSRILAQKASHLTYAVDRVKVQIDVENFNGIKDEVNKDLKEIPKGQQEVVERVVEQDNFNLVINNAKLPFALTPRGDFQDDITTKRELPGCKLSITHHAKIQSNYDTVEMELKLKAELTGDFCRGTLENQLKEFVKQQLDTYPITTLKNAYESLGQTLAGLKKVDYTVTLQGKVM